MLYEFVEANRGAIVDRTRIRMHTRAGPLDRADEREHGVPVFLSQLAETLRSAERAAMVSHAMEETATSHGRDLFALGYSVSQVVHGYGDICQVVTELAIEQEVPITTGEFNILNRCLDIAIADAVTEHARITAESRQTDELERLGRVTHELRNLLNSAVLAFDVVQRGTVGINGSTGALLGRSLAGLRDLVDSMLSDIRMGASHQQPELLFIAQVLDEAAVAARLQARYSGLLFTLEPVDPGMCVDVDPQLFASAVTNLLSNAFKYTPRGGLVVLRAQARDGRVEIEVQDACGGIAEGAGDLFQPFGERRTRNRTGLGLGLSIARKAIRSQGGDIVVRNTPGTGCTFVIDLPLAQAGQLRAYGPDSGLT